MFMKVCIENEFENFGDKDYVTEYAYNLTIDKENIDDSRASIWAYYYYDDEFSFDFILKNDEANERYNSIVNGIKSNCKFHKIVDYYDDKYATYSCYQSQYNGKIGFMIKEQRGKLRHFVKE